jgi:hypothetical protein
MHTPMSNHPYATYSKQLQEERRDRGPPVEWVNWTKWSRKKKRSTEDTLTHV